MNRIPDVYAVVLPGATVTNGLAVQGEEASSSRPQLEQWLRQLRLIS